MKAVVTLGKYFGPKHPRKGQETGFIAKVADGRKVHTWPKAITGIGGQKSKK
jgi:hypothetical protein